jgi:hypothetical protein
VRPSVVSGATGAGAHAPVVSGAAAEVSVVVAEAAVASGTKAHVLVASGAAAELSVVVAGVAIVSGVVAAEVSIGFGVVVAVVAADVSEVSIGAITSDDPVAAASLDLESVVLAEPSGTGEGGTSPRAGAVNRDAQSTAANTATAQPTNPRPRLRSKRSGRIPETAAELPSISAYSPWLSPLTELRVSHLTSGAHGCDGYCRAGFMDVRSPSGGSSSSSGD